MINAPEGGTFFTWGLQYHREPFIQCDIDGALANMISGQQQEKVLYATSCKSKLDFISSFPIVRDLIPIKEFNHACCQRTVKAGNHF